MKLLFLDNDGVLNRGDIDRHPNSYLPLRWENVCELNRILDDVPDCQIVVSSAWRYSVLNKDMTLKGIESLYMHFGINARGRIHGVTDKDPYHHGDPEVEGWTNEQWHERGIAWRSTQVAAYWKRSGEPRCAVLDDLPLVLGEALFQTDRLIGLTPEIADGVIERLA